MNTTDPHDERCKHGYDLEYCDICFPDPAEPDPKWRANPDLETRRGGLYWYRYSKKHICPAWINDLLPGPPKATLPWGEFPLSDLRGDWWGPLPQPEKPLPLPPDGLPEI